MSTGKNRLMTTPQTEFTLLNEKWFSIHYFQNRHYCLVNLNLTPFAKGGQRKVHYAYLNHSESDIGAVSIRKVKNQFSPFSSPEYLLTKKILSSPPDEVNQLIKIYAQFFFNQDELNYSQVMKYYYQGDLGEYIVNKTRVFFSDEELISVILQCAEGVTQLHNLGFWHRDIKPKNFFSTYRSPQMKAPNNIEVVLGDFGLTYPRNQSVCKKVGTTCYIAPEILTSSEYSDAADVYSLGITLAEVVFRSRLIPKEMAKAEKILTFKSACESKNISSTLEAAISHGNLNTSSHQNRLIVEHLIELCKSCTQYRPENRPSLRDIVSKIRSIALEWNELNPKLP
ncbi:MAG: protein kinase [Chlamydiia bacterium]|nr:protein kinase [Chlamydiia bacterium]